MEKKFNLDNLPEIILQHKNSKTAYILFEHQDFSRSAQNFWMEMNVFNLYHLPEMNGQYQFQNCLKHFPASEIFQRAEFWAELRFVRPL
jgi:hypothetical protein